MTARSEGIGKAWTVFEIRNDTEHPVTFAGFLDEDPKTIWYDSIGLEIRPQSTGEVSALWELTNRPNLVHAYVVPWTYDEEREATERYSRFPEPIGGWFMRKYDQHQPAYRHEVVVPESR